ncbi:phosphate signaling complex protein PhoU [Myxococcota bacterium]|nr:phosphate signaling complex protein PhoU [Myxococcota bacterium]
MDKRLDGLRERLLRMGGLAESILEKALQSLADRDGDLAAQVKQDDLAIDRLDVEIDQAVLELIALQAPVADDLRQALAIKVAAVDLERVGDLARDIADSTFELLKQPPVQPPAVFGDLIEESRRSLSAALTAFADADAEKARWVLQADDRIDDDEALVIRESLKRIRTEPESSEAALQHILIAKCLERVGDHATNIAEDVIMVAESVNLKHAGKLGEEAD